MHGFSTTVSTISIGNLFSYIVYQRIFIPLTPIYQYNHKLRFLGLSLTTQTLGGFKLPQTYITSSGFG